MLVGPPKEPRPQLSGDLDTDAPGHAGSDRIHAVESRSGLSGPDESGRYELNYEPV